MEARRQQSSPTAPTTGTLMKDALRCFMMRLYRVALLVWREDSWYLEVFRELMKEGLILIRCPAFPTTLPNGTVPGSPTSTYRNPVQWHL